MSHPAQVEYCKKIKGRFPEYFSNIRVIDFGSLDINGCNRYLFNLCEYTGVDIGPGRNVDIVSKAHEYNGTSESFDVVISTEMFEHDMFLHQSLPNMIRVLKPGGLFLFTCATGDRPEHGTRRTSTADSPLTTMIDSWTDYYKNISEQDIRDIIDIDSTFSQYEFDIWQNVDLRFYGIKKG